LEKIVQEKDLVSEESREAAVERAALQAEG
jgi:hypothetical protein